MSICGNPTVTTEASEQAGHGVGLRLDIQQPRHMNSMMSYLRAKLYHEEVDLPCDSDQCIGNGYHKRVRRRHITQAPEVLVIRINRFTVQTENGTYEPVKLKDPVYFENMIDLSEFTKDGSQLFYELQSVVAHHGDGIDNGHYIAAVRELDRVNFCTINDDQVRNERNDTDDPREVQHPRSRGQDYEPYILFYNLMPR